MGKLNWNEVSNYLQKFENSRLINKEIINLSNKIEAFCFKCNKDNLSNLCFSSYISEDKYVNTTDKLKFNDNFYNEESFLISSFDKNSHYKINYNPIPYLDHDILNKYLYLSDYLENSFDKNKAIIYLNNIINSKQLTKSTIINKSLINQNLLNSILNNQSNVTKDIAIKLCFALDLNYDETIDLLLRFGYTLSTLNKRDCIIRYSIDNRLSIDEIDYVLKELNEKTLFQK